MKWGPFLPKGGGMIPVDIGGHPPTPLSQFHQFSYLLFLSVLWVMNFQSHFEALKNVDLGDIFPTRYHTCQTKIL